MTEIDACVLAGDLHIFSTVALLRPGYVTANGNEIGINKLQRWFWDQYTSCIGELHKVLKGRRFILILNGDMIEGVHHHTTEILGNDPAEHARAAIYTLEPLVKKAAKIYVIQGTECHTGNLEDMIGKEIGAVPYENGRYAWPQLRLEIQGTLGGIRHHMPTSSRKWTESSQLGIQAVNARTASLDAGERVPDWLAMAHRHVPGEWTDYRKAAYVTPAWQALTRFGNKAVPDGKVAPGFILLDWSILGPGRLPVDIGIMRWPEPGGIEKA